MNRIIVILVLTSLIGSAPVMAFDENNFRSVLEGYSKIVTKLAELANNGNPDQSDKTGKGNPSDEDFVWLKADKINAQLETMIRGIETAKGVATALAIIINLYEGGNITIDVAYASIKMLRERAVFLRVFITNGDSELEILIHILNEHESEFGKMAQANPGKKVNIEATGKIKHPAPAQK
ncbi:MAG: hypothetical protein GQF41_4220 [Candidatus Rifleibacterium amylolyticum]|nr:MAG: hypothetical protein GQF41_4220 [Candidatus Rifleibacterium amylolyticum]NLF97194.1 hypothetical protein [Candidatus Riflebacteria bacterium]